MAPIAISLVDLNDEFPRQKPDGKMFGSVTRIHGENETEYDKISQKLFAAARPADFSEEILVRDVVDLNWEFHRLRRLKATLLDAKAVEIMRERVGARRCCSF